MLLVVGITVWGLAQTWDLTWHNAHPGTPGHDVAHALFYTGITLAIAGAEWWLGHGVHRSR